MYFIGVIYILCTIAHKITASLSYTCKQMGAMECGDLKGHFSTNIASPFHESAFCKRAGRPKNMKVRGFQLMKGFISLS